MKFSFLNQIVTKWDDILVIGRSVLCDGSKCHFIGMTLEGEEAKLYIIEPFSDEEGETKRTRRKENQRSLLRQTSPEQCYFNCSEFVFGKKKLSVGGSMAEPLKYAERNYPAIMLFLDMAREGWNVPEWLGNTDWQELQLVTHTFEGVKRLPKFSDDMPITVKHNSVPVLYQIEKTVTLNIGGRPRSFSFGTVDGRTEYCHINNVYLLDPWENFEEKYKDPRFAERFSTEEIRRIKEQTAEALSQSCPKGKFYVAVEYECSMDAELQFYTKDFLRSYPKESAGSATAIMMRVKSDKKAGIHNLPLRACLIKVAVDAGTEKIAAELFSYMEKTEEWKEEI